jgi:hypothetical protein
MVHAACPLLSRARRSSSQSPLHQGQINTAAPPRSSSQWLLMRQLGQQSFRHLIEVRHGVGGLVDFCAAIGCAGFALPSLHQHALTNHRVTRMAAKQMCHKRPYAAQTGKKQEHARFPRPCERCARGGWNVWGAICDQQQPSFTVSREVGPVCSNDVAGGPRR